MNGVFESSNEMNGVFESSNEMNGVLGHNSALVRLSGPGTTWINEMNFCYESCPLCRIHRSTC